MGYSGIKQQCLWAQVTKYDIELGQGPPPPATSAHTPCELGKVEGGLSWYWALSQEPLSSEQWWSHLRTEVSFPTKGRCEQFGGVCVSNLLFGYPQQYLVSIKNLYSCKWQKLNSNWLSPEGIYWLRKLGSPEISLVVQRLGPTAFTAGAWLHSLVGELRSRKPHSEPEKKKKYWEIQE